METGNLVDPSHSSSLPQRPLSAVFFLGGVGARLRRVAVWYSSVFCPAYARVSGFLSSLSTAVVLQPPPASRVGVIAAAFSRLHPGGPCVSSGALQRLRFASTPLLMGYPSAVFSLPMLMHTPSPNTAVKAAPFGRWTLRDKAPRSAPYLRR